MIYLATPFWHEAEKIRLGRVASAIFITRALVRLGQPVFSPIVHSHTLNNPDKLGSFRHLPMTNDEWVDLDLSYIKSCQYMLVAQIEGWKESKGIEREIQFCLMKGIPVAYLTPEDCTNLEYDERLQSSTVLK